MRKAIFAGGILAALIVVVVYATRVDAQDRNRFTFQGPFLPLVPGIVDRGYGSRLRSGSRHTRREK